MGVIRVISFARRIVVLLIAGLIVQLLFSFPTSAQVGIGSISGVVLDESGEPITGERVGVVAYFGEDSAAACSDISSGEWALGPLPLDVPIIVAAGYNFWRDCGASNYLVEYWEDAATAEEAIVFTLTLATPDVGSVDFRLATGAMITGTVRDSAGQPILGKKIGLLMQAGTTFEIPVPPDVRQACSEPTDGTYRFLQLVPGNYVIVAGFYFDGCGPFDNPPHNYVLEGWMGSAEPGGITPINIATGGQVISSIDFTLDEGGTISGTVSDTDGLALPAIWVSLDDATLNGACSDATGAYTIVGVALNAPRKVVAGQLVPEMDPYSCQPHGYAAEWWVESPDASSATPVTLPADQRDRSGIDFTLGALTFPGTDVTVQPTVGVTITYDNVTSEGVTDAATSQAGPEPPSGFQLGDPPAYYDLTTTAGFSGEITVCIDYSSLSFGDENELNLYHFEGGLWVNVTSSLNTTDNIICATVGSLSPFAIFEGPWVGIDIKPGGEPNSVNPWSRGTTPVAILSTSGFDAPTQVRRNSVRFGRTGMERSLRSCDADGKDINADGLADLVCHFTTRATGFQDGDSMGMLRARLKDGSTIIGWDSVQIVSR